MPLSDDLKEERKGENVLKKISYLPIQYIKKILSFSSSFRRFFALAYEKSIYLIYPLLRAAHEMIFSINLHVTFMVSAWRVGIELYGNPKGSVIPEFGEFERRLNTK